MTAIRTTAEQPTGALHRLLRAAALLGLGSGMTSPAIGVAAPAARHRTPAGPTRFPTPYDVTAASAALAPGAPGWPARLQ
ncbi:hypothetical protein [Aquihabitans sp. McL0605]|uniref:hypothetical protein n=1 Tax=Aquihabitans sp. McL0605 TaxID=3415671 RepID=UPI003CFB17BA